MRLPTFCKCIAATMLLVAGCATSHASTVTFDAAAKTATSDSVALEPKWVKSNGDQIGLYVQSTTLTPQNATLKITNLRPGRYDVYVNWGGFRIEQSLAVEMDSGVPYGTANIEPGYLIKDKDAGELAEGLSISIPGRVVPPAVMRCMESVMPAAQQVYEGFGSVKTGETGRARHTLGQAVEWARSVIQHDETYRSAQAFVLPTGVQPKRMDWRLRLTKAGVDETAELNQLRLHEARVRMYGALTDSTLRNTVLEALMPVEMKLKYATNNGVPWVRVDITNNVDMDISGAVNVHIPKGWTAKAQKPTFLGLKSGEVWKQAFRLVPDAKGQAAPKKLSVTSTIRVADKEGFAKLNIVRYAEL